MSKSVNIDFVKLDKDIADLKTLQSRLDEPNYNSVTFWLGDTAGDGMTREYLIRFCNDTIKFNNSVSQLISHTVAYLESVKKLQQADENIADNL